jgi:cytochrome bd ubiquinol oxidase subunit I
MVGLGTIFMGVYAIAVLLLFRDRLFRVPLMLWALMLLMPFPYIANEAGWVVSEVGRQPWIIYGIMRTSEGVSPTVTSGETLFTLIGFAGMYFLLGVLFLLLVLREIAIGPSGAEHAQRGAEQ